MFLEIIFVVVMLLWFLSVLPFPPMNQYPVASNVLAFIAVLILGIEIFAGGPLTTR